MHVHKRVGSSRILYVEKVQGYSVDYHFMTTREVVMVVWGGLKKSCEKNYTTSQDLPQLNLGITHRANMSRHGQILHVGRECCTISCADSALTFNALNIKGAFFLRGEIYGK